ncbi:hypothetical protein L249_8722 [Ophiocordyceps polyrhachis-furcata BCC 54312]|uniref:Uncharacterized protein n=1 Tax=Ophiocordyceps polyrhachis-furcata BCC 54312 TaxID=1330021 RepID=A0A367L725_9HYPO|nr:hypothetical protein L249_8722 [Ophiocordyceps polyrhachis-furcata BCC 54312]
MSWEKDKEENPSLVRKRYQLYPSSPCGIGDLRQPRQRAGPTEGWAEERGEGREEREDERRGKEDEKFVRHLHVIVCSVRCWAGLGPRAGRLREKKDA